MNEKQAKRIRRAERAYRRSMTPGPQASQLAKLVRWSWSRLVSHRARGRVAELLASGPDGLLHAAVTLARGPIHPPGTDTVHARAL